MKIYKNIWTSRRNYFIPIGPERSMEMEAAKTGGYAIEEWQGKWKIRKAQYYNHTLSEMPIVGEVRKETLQNAVIDYVLAKIKDGDGEEEQT